MASRRFRSCLAVLVVGLAAGAFGLHHLYERIRPRIASSRALRCLTVTPDGRRAATGDAGGTISVWDLATGAELASFKRSLAAAPPPGVPDVITDCEVRGLAFVPGRDELVAVFHLGPGYATPTTGEIENVGAARFRWHHAVVVFDFKGQELRRFEDPGSLDAADTLAVTPDGESVLVARPSAGDKASPLRLLDLATGAPRWPVSAPEDPRRVTALAIAPTGTLALAALGETGRKKSLRGLDVTTGATVFELDRGLDVPINALAFAPDGATFATAAGGPIESENTRFEGDFKNTYSEWDPTVKSGFEVAIRRGTDGSEIRKLVGHKAPVLSVAFTPDGKRVVSGAEDGEVIMWDAATGAALQRTRASRFGVVGVAALAGPPRLLVAGGSVDWDGTDPRGMLALLAAEGDEPPSFLEQTAR